MKEKKTTVIANFNCTFGENNEPMLNYFDKIIYPAFTGEYVRRVKDNDIYFFQDVKVIRTEDNRYILQGLCVRKTKLEVKTEYDEKNKKIEFINKMYETAPISVFTLFLDNHILLYTTNQKGSPNLKGFGATVKDIIKQRVKQYNEDKSKDRKISNPVIDIVDIPSANGINEQFKYIKKIKKLHYRFFNPNGDIDDKEATDWIYDKLDRYKSKNAQLSFNSPKDIEQVKNDIDKTHGYAEVIAEVEFINGSKGKVRNENLSEKYEIEVSTDSTINEVAKIAIDTLSSNEFVKQVRTENEKILNKNKDRIEKFL